MNCFGDKTSDQLVAYTGDDVEINGEKVLSKGDTYDKVIASAFGLLKQIMETRIDVSCLMDGMCGNCEPEQSVEDSISSLVNAFCNLSADDIKIDGITSFPNKFHGSHGKMVTYNVEPNNGNVGFSFDLKDHREVKGYKYSRVKFYSGNKLFRTVDSDSGSVSLDYSKFPLRVDYESYFSDEEGDMKMTGTSFLGKPVNIKNGIVRMDCVGSSGIQSKTLKDAVVGINSRADIIEGNYKSLMGYTNSEIGVSGIENVLSACVSRNIALDNKVDEINNVQYSGCEDCNENRGGTIQEAVACIGDRATNAEQSFSDLNSKYDNLKLELDSITSRSKENSYRVSTVQASGGCGGGSVVVSGGVVVGSDGTDSGDSTGTCGIGGCGR